MSTRQYRTETWTPSEPVLDFPITSWIPRPMLNNLEAMVCALCAKCGRMRLPTSIVSRERCLQVKPAKCRIQKMLSSVVFAATTGRGGRVDALLAAVV